jgi:L-ascorbate metabolism protein UlaG (beta-lactamase superfamily)
VYHTGDTGLFGDMKLIGEMNNIDIIAMPNWRLISQWGLTTL